MAAVSREIEIGRSREFVWDAIRDVGAIHKRLVPGFVVSCLLEDGARIVTFDNGMVLRELIVDVDDRTFRHSWATHDEPFVHYNASVQVFPNGPDRCRVVWIADLLPNELASDIEKAIERGLNVMKRTLERG
jgi:Polyketide cyclase / dehydrase and lipid transport